MDLPLHEDDLARAGRARSAHAAPSTERTSRPSRSCASSTNSSSSSRAKASSRSKYVLRSEIGRNPVYEFADGRGPVAVVHPGVGAPLAAGFVEEIAALGVTTLRRVRRRGRPGRRAGPRSRHGRGVGAARRGHELPLRRAESDHRRRSARRARPGRGAERDTTSSTSSVARGRPTPSFARPASRVERRIDEHCSMVDMESSAFIAVAQYRGLRFAQLLYAGDSLAGEEWDSRSWTSARARTRDVLSTERHRRASPARGAPNGRRRAPVREVRSLVGHPDPVADERDRVREIEVVLRAREHRDHFAGRERRSHSPWSRSGPTCRGSWSRRRSRSDAIAVTTLESVLRDPWMNRMKAPDLGVHLGE